MTRRMLFVLLAVFLIVPRGLVLAQGLSNPDAATAPNPSPGVPPAPVAPTEVFGWQLTFGILVNEAMKKLKASKLVPWMSAGTKKLNLVVAACLAAASALGIHTEFDKTAGTLLVTGLTSMSLIHFGGEWLRQFALQHFAYHATKEDY